MAVTVRASNQLEGSVLTKLNYVPNRGMNDFAEILTG
jgi:hypothetical protein